MLSLLFLLSQFTLAAQTSCTGYLSLRKEWRELSSTDQNAFFSAVNALKKAPSQLGQPNRYDDFAYLHSDFAQIAHGNPMFLVWHRKFLKDFEIDLSNVSGKNISLPYWQWSIDSQAPEKSSLLQANAFGTGGNENGCVVDGLFANWKNGDASCLSRGYGKKAISAFYSGEHIASVVKNSAGYNDLWLNVEGALHSIPHLGIGGDLAKMSSPRDPLFFLRKYFFNPDHAYIDKSGTTGKL